jgi:cation transport ATPase
VIPSHSKRSFGPDCRAKVLALPAAVEAQSGRPIASAILCAPRAECIAQPDVSRFVSDHRTWRVRPRRGLQRGRKSIDVKQIAKSA